MNDKMYGRRDENGNELLSNDGMVWYSGLVDEHGNQIERTPNEYPYSYDGYVLHRMGEQKEANNTIYSDRLYQWDYKKHNRLCEKHFGNEGQYWDNRSPEKIEEFLRDWCEDPDLKLILVMQYCNISSGYPLWRFDFKQTLKDETKG